jgi:hypothetical protein
LYNGTEPYPEREEIRLSDAFKSAEGLKLPGGSVSLELVVQVYNINYGYNKQMLDKCATLEGYSLFVSKIREYNKKLPLDESVIEAVKYCVKNDVLRKYLEENSAEVLNMLLEEWTLEEEMAVLKEEAREEGREEGLAEGREEGLEKGREEGLEEGLSKGKLEIARNALTEGLSVEFVQKITGLDIETITNL